MHIPSCLIFLSLILKLSLAIHVRRSAMPVYFGIEQQQPRPLSQPFSLANYRMSPYSRKNAFEQIPNEAHSKEVRLIARPVKAEPLDTSNSGLHGENPKKGRTEGSETPRLRWSPLSRLLTHECYCTVMQADGSNRRVRVGAL